MERTRQGPSDLPATLSAALVGETSGAKLYVRGLVRDESGSGRGEVRLLSAAGTPITPERIERSPIRGGYAWQATYNPSSLQVRDDRLEARRLGQAQPGRQDASEVTDLARAAVFRGALEVISRSASGQERWVISTARSRRRSGLLWITVPKMPGLGVNDPLFEYQPADF